MKFILQWGILLTLGTSSSVAIPRNQLYYYGPDVDAMLPKEHESSSPELQLQVPIVFYGDTYNTIFVNSNGMLSFLIDIPAFLSIEFPLDYPVIAPLYSNVDIRGSGNVFFRETDDEVLLERATRSVRASFSAASNFTASSLFIATWSNVGYYKLGSDKQNTFQVAIASSGNDSYATFLYADGGVQWLRGAGEGGAPDARAQAGVVAGDGRFFTLRSSGADQLRHLHRWTNADKNGVWLFHIGNIGESANVMGPDLVSAQDAATCQEGGDTLCHSQARCTDFEAGFCCACKDGFYGDGHNCLPDGAPLRVSGKVRGTLNEVALAGLHLQSYVVTGDGRTYTALSRVPPSLGYDMQILHMIGGVVGWLFARPLAGARNGFQLTGGVFNHTSKLVFPHTGHKVTLTQKYSGIDVFDQLKVKVEIEGTIPAVPAGTKIDISEYEEQYVRSGPGVLVSRKTQSFRLEGVPVDTPFDVEQVIEFDECAASAHNETSVRMRVARNLVTYEAREQIVRYGMTSKILPPGEHDPCQEGRKSCVEHSSCVAREDSFQCVCDSGYQFVYGEGGGATCVDVNECGAGSHDCHKHALCVNEEGGFRCRCNAGYAGDGRHCELMDCADVECHPQAKCTQLAPGRFQCQCLQGYTGDGLHCEAVQSKRCIDANNCSPLATCQLDESQQAFRCVCLPGYHGDGYSCTATAESGAFAEPDCAAGPCLCPDDFVLDGLLCTRTNATQPHTHLSCNVINTCHPQAQCVYFPHQGTYQCQCNAGYEGDGYECNESDVSCLEVDICDTHASCEYDDVAAKHVCRCDVGFRMEGEYCVPIHECQVHSDCGANALCTWSYQFNHYQCICKEGFILRENGCQAERGIFCERECHHQAFCLYNEHTEKYECVCQPGHVGNGTMCEEEAAACNILNNCGVGAECVYEPRAPGYRCKCKQGYWNNGSECISQITCYDQPDMCNENASCVLDSYGLYTCQCNAGFRGNGVICKTISKSESKFLLVNQGMAVLRIPVSVEASEENRPITMRPFQEAIGIDADCLERRVYWSDIAGKVIRSALFNGSDVTVFLKSDLGSLEGLAIDWISRNIYWTDSAKDTIEVANLDHKGRKILFSEDLVNPRGIAVHPGRGKLFWSDWNRVAPKLEWANMDGTMRSVFLQGQSVSLPNSLTVDWESDELCWADAGIHAIGCISISTLDVRIVVKDISHPFGLAVTPDNYYWTDWITHKVESAQKRSGKRNEPYSILMRGIGKLYGLIVVEEKCPALTNACNFNNGHCGLGQLCLPNGFGGRNCSCGDFDGEGSGDEPSCNILQ